MIMQKKPRDLDTFQYLLVTSAPSVDHQYLPQPLHTCVDSLVVPSSLIHEGAQLSTVPICSYTAVLCTCEEHGISAPVNPEVVSEPAVRGCTNPSEPYTGTSASFLPHITKPTLRSLPPFPPLNYAVTRPDILLEIRPYK